MNSNTMPLNLCDRVVLGILTVVVCSANLLWIFRDQGLEPYPDNYMYRIRLLSFVDKLDTATWSQLWSSLGELSVLGRPPLYQLLSVPFIYLFGRSEDTAVVVNILFLAMLIVSTYHVGRLVKNGKAGLLAALVVSSFPPIINISHWHLPHAALPACVALSLWLLLEIITKRSIKTAWAFGASLAFGLLIRHNFMLILAVPTAVFGLYMLLFQMRPRWPAHFRETPAWLANRVGDRFIVFGLLPGAIISLSALFWYATWGRRLADTLDFVQSVGLMAFGFPGVEPSFWWYLQTSPSAISYLFTAGAACGLLLAIAKPRIETSVLVVTLMSSYILLTSMTALVWWNFAAILPIVAVLSTTWIFRLRYRWLAQGLVVIYATTSIFNFSLVAWGIPAALRPAAIALGYPLDSEACHAQYARLSLGLCSIPPDREPEKHPTREIIRTIFSDSISNDSKCRERPCVLTSFYMGTYIGVRPATLLYFVRKEWPDFRLRLRGLEGGGRRLDINALLESDYLLYPDGWMAPSRNTMDAVRLIESSPDAFADAHQLLATFEFPDGRKIKLVKRINSSKVGEPDSSYEPAGELLRLARVHRAEGDVASAESCLRRAIDANVLVEEATRELAWLLVEVARGEEAVEVITLRINRVSGVDWLRLNLIKAQILSRLGEFERARAEVNRAYAITVRLASRGARIGWKELIAGLYQDLARIETAQSDFKLLLGTGGSASPALAGLLEELRVNAINPGERSPR